MQKATQKLIQNFPWVPKIEGLRKPLLSTLLGNRKLALILIGIAAFQVILTAFGLPGWRCPINAALGIPCPGCGLSRATVLLLQGEWLAAVKMHAFAPVFLAGFGLMTGVSLLPAPSHVKTVERIALFEKKTGLTVVILIGMLFFWLARLVIRLQVFS